MQISRRAFLTALSSLCALAVTPARARAYEPIANPQPTDVAGKIEVLEFFSYGCGHCFELNPLLKRWLEKAPASVYFVRSPVTWNAPWMSLARLYYTLEATGDLARLDDAVFVALHKERRNLFTPQAMEAWVAKQGGNVKNFRAAFNSFGIENKLQQATRRMQNMGIDSVPALIVNGRYRVLGDTFPEQLANLDTLIAELSSAPKTTR